MALIFKKVQEGMPEEHQVVLVFLEGSGTPNEGRWALAYYDGSKWCFDVPEEVIRHAEAYTGVSIPEGEDIVEVGPSRISHWARLPLHPLFDVFALSEVEVKSNPIVRYNRADDTIDIFGGTTNYTEENPYYLDRSHFDTSAAALRAMAHVALKKWVGTEGFLYALAAALAEALEAKKNGVG
jgi:hypothetical protein